MKKKTNQVLRQHKRRKFLKTFPKKNASIYIVNAIGFFFQEISSSLFFLLSEKRIGIILVVKSSPYVLMKPESPQAHRVGFF